MTIVVPIKIKLPIKFVQFVIITNDEFTKISFFY